MSLKDQNKFFLVTSLITFVMIVFTFYITVFDQIISQNQGFFYAIVFGVVLVLAFVLCNLFTKLLAVSANLNTSKIFKIISLSCFGVIAIVFIALRFRYNSNLSTYDSDVIKCASSMAAGSLAGKNDIIAIIRRNPTDFLYAVVLTPIIKFLGESNGAIMTVNAFFMILSAFFAYRCVQLISDRICALIAAFGCLIIPGQSFAVYAFDSDVVLAALIFLAMDLYIHFWYLEDDVDEKIRYAYVIGCGAAMGLVMVSEPTMLIAVVLMYVGVYILKKRELKNILISLGCSFGVVLICILIKTFITDISIIDSLADFGNAFAGLFPGSNSGISSSQVFDGFLEGINNQNYYINDSYYFLYGSNGAAYSQLNAAWICLVNQIMYMFVLVMGMMCMIYSIRGSYIQVLPVNIMFIGSFISLIFQAMRNQATFPFMSLLIVLTGICMNYMYLNHHPELDDVSQFIQSISEGVETVEDEGGNVEVMSESAFLDRAKALIFVGENDKLYHSIKEQELEKAKKEFPDRLPSVPKADEVVNSEVPEKEPYFFDNEDKVEETDEELETSADDFDDKSSEEDLISVPQKNSDLVDSEENAEEIVEEKTEDEKAETDNVEADNVEVEAVEEENTEEEVAEKAITEEAAAEETVAEEEKAVEDKTEEEKETTEPEAEKKITVPELKPIVVEKFIRDESDSEAEENKTVDNVPGEAEDSCVSEVESEDAKTEEIDSEDLNEDENEKAELQKESPKKVITATGVVKKKPAAVKKGKPLHNPLPTPKKHEHKTIDFDYKNDKGDSDGWDFDYEVADDDDWDYD